MSFLINHRLLSWSQFFDFSWCIRCGGVVGWAVIWFIYCTSRGGVVAWRGLFFNVCIFSCDNCANCVKPDRTTTHKQRITTLLVTKNHNNSTHYREIKNYISHSEQRLEILVWEKKAVLIICYVHCVIHSTIKNIQHVGVLMIMIG